jgi:hypothetical protein
MTQSVESWAQMEDTIMIMCWRCMPGVERCTPVIDAKLQRTHLVTMCRVGCKLENGHVFVKYGLTILYNTPVLIIDADIGLLLQR